MIEFLRASAAVVVASDLMGGCFGIAVIQAGLEVRWGTGIQANVGDWSVSSPLEGLFVSASLNIRFFIPT